MAIKEGIADLTRLRKKYQFNFFEAASLLVSGANSFNSAVIDQLNGFAYFGSQDAPGKITKIDLSNFTIASTLTLNSGENVLTSAVIESGFAYFGTNTLPGIIAKINLTTFTEVSGPIVFLSGEQSLNTAAVIDTANRVAYFGCNENINNTAKIVKVDLSTFTRASSLTTNSGEKSLTCAVIDTVSGIGYFAGTGPGVGSVLMRYNLSTFTQISGHLNLASFGANSMVIDQPNGFAYIGYNDRFITKVNLSTFTTASNITTVGNEVNMHCAVIDTVYGFVYIGCQINPGIIIKVNLGTFSKAGDIVFTLGDASPTSAVIDQPNGFAYFGFLTNPGRIKKIAIV